MDSENIIFSMVVSRNFCMKMVKLNFTKNSIKMVINNQDFIRIIHLGKNFVKFIIKTAVYRMG